MQTRSAPVLVGIDGSPSSIQAMLWAAAEADRRGVALKLAFAAELPILRALSDTTLRTARAEYVEYGHQLMADVIATLADLHPTVRVMSTVRTDSATDLLVDLSLKCDLVVVGRSADHHLHGATAGSIAHRVAARTPCPVVIVNPGVPFEARPIVVGISVTPGGLNAMRFACTEARVRNVPVRGIRAWSDFGSLNEITMQASYENRCYDEQTVVDNWTAIACQEFPDVAIETDINHASIFAALENESRNADLLVLGCKRDDDALLSRLGPLTSWLCAHAACSVAIVGHAGIAAVSQPIEADLSLVAATTRLGTNTG